jgi:aspartyl/asparaginyl beta-hydroxylase (cupin superfamily)
VPDPRPMQTAAVKIGKRLRDPFNRLIARHSLVPNTPYLDPELFPWVETLRHSWKDARAELDEVLKDRESLPPFAEISPDHRRIAGDGKWKSFFFKAYGYRSSANISRCPKTAALIDSIPGAVVAFFSVMEPGTHVPRHRGVTKALINVHLGLRIPAGIDKCRISVDNEIRGWKDGEVVILDDTYPHEVWNETDRPRAILFLQIRRPVRLFGRMLGGAFLKGVRFTSYVQDGRRLLQA